MTTADTDTRAHDLAEVLRVMKMVAADCETDAAALDSTPFTPRGVGGVLGETLAMVKTIAVSVATLADTLADTDSVKSGVST